MFCRTLEMIAEVSLVDNPDDTTEGGDSDDRPEAASSDEKYDEDDSEVSADSRGIAYP